MPNSELQYVLMQFCESCAVPVVLCCAFEAECKLQASRKCNILFTIYLVVDYAEAISRDILDFVIS